MNKRVGIVLPIVMAVALSGLAMWGSGAEENTKEHLGQGNVQAEKKAESNDNQNFSEENSKVKETSDSTEVKNNTNQEIEKTESKISSNQVVDTKTKVATAPKSEPTTQTKPKTTTTQPTTTTKTETTKTTEQTKKPTTSTQPKEEPRSEFYVAPPTQSGYNSNLTRKVNAILPQYYNGAKKTYFDSLTKELAIGQKSDNQIRSILKSLIWEENTDVVPSGKAEINIIPETLVVSKFTDKTNDYAKIREEIASRGGVNPKNKYSNVYIIYNAETKTNTVAFIGIGFYYLEHNN